jgi:hypothetical protein
MSSSNAGTPPVPAAISPKPIAFGVIWSNAA